MGERAQADGHPFGGSELRSSAGAAAGGHDQHAGVCETLFR